MKSTQIEANTPVGKVDKIAAGKSLAKQQEKDREMVRGRFRFFEVQGGTMSFVYRCYKTEDVERYDFVDGEIYTIPYGVARHLNKNCWYPEYGYINPNNPNDKTMGGYNSLAGQGMRMCKKVQRMGFESLEFVDLDDVAPMASPIITIENY
jgi:hypothetical protein